MKGSDIVKATWAGSGMHSRSHSSRASPAGQGTEQNAHCRLMAAAASSVPAHAAGHDALQAVRAAAAAPKPKRKARAKGGKRNRLTLEQKLAILTDKDNNMKQAAIARKYNVSESTISVVLKNRLKIQDKARKMNKKAKNTRAGKYPLLELALYHRLDTCNGVFNKTSIGISQRMVRAPTCCCACASHSCCARS